MGVKHLWKILTPFFIEATPINERIGIDASIWIYQLNSLPTEKMIYILIKRIIKLKYENNKLIFVFDGTPHELKKETIKYRQEMLNKKREEMDFKDFQKHLKLISNQNIQNLEEFKTKFFSIEKNEIESKVLSNQLSKFEKQDLLDWGFAGRSNKNKKLQELIDLKYNSIFENEYDENKIEEFSKNQIQNVAKRNKLARQISDLNSNERKIVSNYRKSYVLEDVKKRNNLEENLKIFESSSETEEKRPQFDVFDNKFNILFDSTRKSINNEDDHTDTEMKNDNISSVNHLINKEDIFNREKEVSHTKNLYRNSVNEDNINGPVELTKTSESAKPQPNNMNPIYLEHYFTATSSSHEIKTQKTANKDENLSISEIDPKHLIQDNKLRFESVSQTSHNQETNTTPSSPETLAPKISNPQEYKETLTSSASIFKRVLNIFNIPFIDSLEESDSQLAYLQSNDFIDSIISDDSDILLYGGSNIYKNWSKECKKIRLEDVCTKYTKEDLIKFSILLGSDYSLGKYGYGIQKAVKELNSFEYDEKELNTIKELYERINVYRKTEIIKQPKIKYINTQITNWEVVIRFIEANFHGMQKKELLLLINVLKNTNNLK